MLVFFIFSILLTRLYKRAFGARSFSRSHPSWGAFQTQGSGRVKVFRAQRALMRPASLRLAHTHGRMAPEVPNERPRRLFFLVNSEGTYTLITVSCGSDIVWCLFDTGRHLLSEPLLEKHP